MTDCPSQSQLAGLLAGQIEEQEQRAIETHVEKCEDCQRALAELVAIEEGVPPLSAFVTPRAPSDEVSSEILRRLTQRHPLASAGVNTTSFRSQTLIASPPFSEREYPSIPGFEILSELGRGGMGVVFKARQVALDRLVALKVILTGETIGVEPERVARFRLEAEALACLQHPNIVQIHEVGEVSGLLFLVLELVEGPSLASRLREGPLPAEQAANLLTLLSRAVHHAHQHGVIHRDLKPANVLLGSDTAKVTDFGLAKRLGGQSTLSRSGNIAGTPSYMAPEQASGQNGKVGEATDVYGLGAILYECLTGRPPFNAATPLETLMQVTCEDPVSPTQLQAKLPKDLETVCLKCLRKDPSQRYPTAQALADDLARYLNGEPVEARPVGFVERAVKWIWRRPAVAGLLGVIICGTVTAFSLLALAWQNANDARLAEAIQRQQAEDEKVQAQQARDRETRLRIEIDDRCRAFKQLSLGLLLDRATNLGEHMDSAHGLHWLTRGLELVGEEDANLERVFRSNLASWSAHVHPLRFVLSPAFGMRWAPDGKTLFSWAGNRVERWDALTGSLGGRLPHKATVHDLAIGGDGKRNPWRVITGCADKKALVWDLVSGEVIAVLPHPNSVHKVALSPDGKQALTACQDIARLWDVEKVAQLVALRHPEGVLAASFSPDGASLLSVCADRNVRLWSLAGAPIGKPMAHTHPVLSATFSPDGKQIATVTALSVQFWNAETAEAVGPPLPRGHKCLAYLPSVEAFLVAHGPVARLMNRELQEMLTTLPHEAVTLRRPAAGQASVSALAARNALFATGNNDANVRLWRHSSYGLAEQVGGLMPHYRVPVEIAFGPGGKTVATRSSNHVVRVFEIRQPAEFPRMVLYRDSHEMKRTILSRDARVGVLIDTGKFTLFRVEQGKQLVFLHKPIERGTAHNTLAFDGKGDTLLTTPTLRTLSLLDVATGQPRGQPITAESDLLVATLSEDGATILAGGGRKVALYDVKSGKRRGQVMEHPGQLSACVALSPDGSVAATATGDGMIRLYDGQGKALGRELAHRGLVRVLEFSRDGKRLLSGSEDHTTRLWDVATGKPVTPPMGHTRAVNAVAISPDGLVLLTGLTDGAVQAWDAATGKPLGPMLWTVGVVTALAFAPDGTTFTAVSQSAIYTNLTVPRPVVGDVERLTLWVQVLTGLELDADGVFRALQSSAWRERKQRLDKLGGPPLP